MKIESKRIILRKWEDGDVEDIVDGLNNIEVAKWIWNRSDKTFARIWI